MPVLYENVFQLAVMNSFLLLNFIYIHLFPIHINFNLYLGMNETNETAILEKTTVSFHSGLKVHFMVKKITRTIDMYCLSTTCLL